MPVIFDIKRFALHDGPGIRTTVFFKGCPLRCAWCHNPESHTSDPEEFEEIRLIDGKEISMSRIFGRSVKEEDLVREILSDKVFFNESNGGVTFSGGEPLMQYRDLISLLEKLGSEGVHRAVDTSGYASPSVLEKVAIHTDLFLYDIKLIDNDLHEKYTGVGNAQILANADRLLKLGSEVIFRVPVIPGINDGHKEREALLKFFMERKGTFRELHLLPYHRIAQGKYRRMDKEYTLEKLQEPSDSFMRGWKEEFETCGAEVIIGG